MLMILTGSFTIILFVLLKTRAFTGTSAEISISLRDSISKVFLRNLKISNIQSLSECRLHRPKCEIGQ